MTFAMFTETNEALKTNSKGKLYSSEFNQSFDTRHFVYSIKQDESGKFDFKINRVSHVSWFSKKIDEFGEAIRMPKSRQNRNIKL